MQLSEEWIEISRSKSGEDRTSDLRGLWLERVKFCFALNKNEDPLCRSREMRNNKVIR